jgi:hypothetical protein
VLRVEPATVSITAEAKDSQQGVTLWVSKGETNVPMSRRLLNQETAHPFGRSAPEIQQMWVRDTLARLDQGYTLHGEVPITAHAISLVPGFRMIGIEGELDAH